MHFPSEMAWRWTVQALDKKKNDTVVICNYCFKDVSFANMEKAALTSHMKGNKHIERSPSEQCIKSLMSPTPAPPLIILKISLSGVLSFLPIVNYPLWSFSKLVCLESGVSSSKLPSEIILEISSSGGWSYQ